MTCHVFGFAKIPAAYVAVLSFNHPWEHPTDFLDVTFMVGFCALILRKSHYRSEACLLWREYGMSAMSLT
jgi:hypothetical protein